MFNEIAAGAAADEETTGTEELVCTVEVLGVLGKVETDTGPELAGKDRAASEQEEAAEGMSAHRRVVEVVGMEKFGSGG